MSYYEDKPADELAEDTKAFLESEYGKHLAGMLRDKARGYLLFTTDIDVEHPGRYAAKYAAIKEVWDLIHQPLDDDIPPLG